MDFTTACTLGAVELKRELSLHGQPTEGRAPELLHRLLQVRFP